MSLCRLPFSFSKIRYFNNIQAFDAIKKDFENRLSWYYQQALKISFVIDFVNRFKKKVVIWDADTIILKKIKFF